MTDRQDVQAGRNASEVLDNPAYKEAMQLLRDAVVQQWLTHPVQDKEGALLLLQYAKVTERFEAILSGLVEKGKLAQHRIEIDALRDESKLKQAARKFF
jgi:predicted transcriptional regulator